MNLKEAQELSPCKTAVYGNIAMRDVIWPSITELPLVWITNGYAAILNPKALDNLTTSDKWEPLDDSNWKMKIYEKE